jgi:hypothetical protein
MTLDPSEKIAAPPMTLADWLGSVLETPSDKSAAPIMRSKREKKSDKSSRILFLFITSRAKELIPDSGERCEAEVRVVHRL